MQRCAPSWRGESNARCVRYLKVKCKYMNSVESNFYLALLSDAKQSRGSSASSHDVALL